MIQVVLQIKNANANLKELVVSESTVIGRGADCGIRVASVEVSRKHCRIEIKNDKVTIIDLGSSNGTYVNSQKLIPNTPKAIVHSSIVQIGPMEATVLIRNSKMAPVVSSKPAASVTKSPKISSDKLIPETDETVAVDPISAKKSSRKKTDDTIPMSPNMQELYDEALREEAVNDIIKDQPKVSLNKKDVITTKTQDLTANKKDKVPELFDQIIVEDSSPDLEVMIDSNGSDIIILEESSSMVPEDDLEQDIADYLQNLKEDSTP